MSIYPSEKALSYVYRLDHPVTGEFYIGYRMKNVKKNIPSHIDFPEYKTSSKNVKDRFNEFTWYIVAEFFDPKDAYDFEQLLIFENWSIVGRLNKHCTHGKERWDRAGVATSESTKVKLRESHKGKPIHIHTEEEKNKISEKALNRSKLNLNYMQSDEGKRLMSSRNSGKGSPTAKIFKVISPNGDEYIVHGELLKFCQSNNLSYDIMHKYSKSNHLVPPFNIKMHGGIKNKPEILKIRNNTTGWFIIPI